MFIFLLSILSSTIYAQDLVQSFNIVSFNGINRPLLTHLKIKQYALQTKDTVTYSATSKRYSFKGTEIEGSLAVKGSAHLNNYWIGYRSKAPTSLIVEGPLSFTYGGLRGNAYVSGAMNVKSIEGSEAIFPSQTIYQRFNFEAEKGRLLDFSYFLYEVAQERGTSPATLHPQGYNGKCHTLLKANGTSAPTVFFSLTPEELTSSWGLCVDANPETTVVINLLGKGLDLVELKGWMHLFGGIKASNILLNVRGVKEIFMHDSTFHGSILAPETDFLFASGTLFGQLIVRELWGAGRHNHAPLKTLSCW